MGSHYKSVGFEYNKHQLCSRGEYGNREIWSFWRFGQVSKRDASFDRYRYRGIGTRQDGHERGDVRGFVGVFGRQNDQSERRLRYVRLCALCDGGR